MVHPLLSVSIGFTTLAAQPVASSFDFIPLISPFIGVVIGGLISAITSFILSGRTNKQQIERDRMAFEQQQKRDHQAYEQQIERDERAYIRSIQEAKRERLRNAYKIVLNGAEAFLFVIQRVSPIVPGKEDELGKYLEKGLMGTEEALVEITLDEPGSNVKSIFFEIRAIYYKYVAKLRSAGSGGPFDPANEWKALEEKVKELRTAMYKSLRAIDI